MSKEISSIPVQVSKRIPTYQPWEGTFPLTHLPLTLAAVRYLEIGGYPAWCPFTCQSISPEGRARL